MNWILKIHIFFHWPPRKRSLVRIISFDAFTISVPSQKAVLNHSTTLFRTGKACDRKALNQMNPARCRSSHSWVKRENRKLPHYSRRSEFALRLVMGDFEVCFRKCHDQLSIILK
jgi:hypothetical protein